MMMTVKKEFQQQSKKNRSAEILWGKRDKFFSIFVV